MRTYEWRIVKYSNYALQMTACTRRSQALRIVFVPSTCGVRVHDDDRTCRVYTNCCTCVAPAVRPCA